MGIFDAMTMALMKHADKRNWPWTCQYYDPLTQDAEYIGCLLSFCTHSLDSEMQPIRYTYIQNGKVYSCEAGVDHTRPGGLLSQEVRESPMVVIHYPANREDGPTTLWGTYSDGSIHVQNKELYKAVLNRFDILPKFLELLHSQQGGRLHHISYGLQPESPLAGCTAPGITSSERRPIAFHSAYDIGDSLLVHNAIYARYDVVAGRSLILVIGDGLTKFSPFLPSSEPAYSRINRLLLSRPDAQVHQVLSALQAKQCNNFQLTRLQFRRDIENLESQTGIGMCTNSGMKVKPENLVFNRDLYASSTLTRLYMRLSATFLEHCHAFNAHLATYQEECQKFGLSSGLDAVSMRNLQDASNLTTSLAKAECDAFEHLHSRVHLQIDINRALMAERDTRINLDTAQAAVRDSKLVRGIAVVTMFFLPATFVATFFSMVFFSADNVEGFQLKVKSSFWIYPAVTVPLTLAVITLFAAWSFGWFSRIPLFEAMSSSQASKVEQKPAHLNQIWPEVRTGDEAGTALEQFRRGTLNWSHESV